MSGKGSKPRPLSVDRKTFAENWDAIFSKKEKREQKRKDKELRETYRLRGS